MRTGTLLEDPSKTTNLLGTAAFFDRGLNPELSNAKK
jgi:hypothetical protein